VLVDADRAAHAASPVGAPAGRAVEAEVLFKAARLLAAAEARPGDVQALAGALDFNLRLWTVLEADLAHEPHPLPVAVRGDLMALCRFMAREIAEAAHRPGEADLAAMIAVNRTLADGLP